MSAILMNVITYEDFSKLDLRVGKITAAEKVEGSQKLIKISVNTGEERQIVSDIADNYQPEDLIGRQIIVLTNLEPKVIFGIESQGMLLATEKENGEVILLTPDKEAPAGAKIS